MHMLKMLEADENILQKMVRFHKSPIEKAGIQYRDEDIKQRSIQWNVRYNWKRRLKLSAMQA